jgi:two-component system response regulator FixJ
VGNLGYTMPVIFLSAVADVSTAVRAMRSGAFNFLEKPVNPQLLIDQIQGALRLDSEKQADRVGVLESMERFDTLSIRERDVLEKVVAGRPNKLVADELGISIKTVEVHRARVMKKMGAESLAELVRMWMLIEPNEARNSP